MTPCLGVRKTAGEGVQPPTTSNSNTDNKSAMIHSQSVNTIDAMQ